MASTASKKLLKQLPTDDEMKDTLFGLLNNTDQAAAITGAAYLEHALQTLLEAHFRDLNSEDRSRMFDGSANGILGTASAKIRIAYAIRLLDAETYHDLLLINDIRNVFGHTLHEIDFTNQLVIEDCSKLNRAPRNAFTYMRFTPPAKGRYLLCIYNIYVKLLQAVPRAITAKLLEDYDHPPLVRGMIEGSAAPIPSPGIQARPSRRSRRRIAASKKPRRPPQSSPA